MQLEAVELKPIEMHWVERVDPFHDCCVHGRLYLRIGSQIVSDGDSDWTLSTAAFNFLRTIFKEHVATQEEDLIPCCGFNMWLEDSLDDGVYVPNCGNGIDWTVRHVESDIAHELSNNVTIYTSKRVWADAVCRFADEVFAFFQTGWPKVIDDEADRAGFERFMTVWAERRLLAEEFLNGENSK